MSEDVILFDVAGGVATIVLNRPDAANAMNMALMRELYRVATVCDNDDGVRAVQISAAGKLFSAGGDLGWFARQREQIKPVLMEATFYLHGAITRFARMRKPLVVAVNGAAAGAGFSLALVGDIRIAAESASFTMAYTAAGLSPDGGSSYFLPRLVGDGRARELMLTNRRLSAAEALDWGLVSEVVPAERLQQVADKMTARLAAGPTAAYATTRELLSASQAATLESQLELEARGIAENAARGDGRAGIDAFLSKTRPVFSGR